MRVQASDIIVGLMVAIFGVVGLVLASRAWDIEMTIFGFSLAGFAVLFILGQIRRHFNTLENARVEVDHA